MLCSLGQPSPSPTYRKEFSMLLLVSSLVLAGMIQERGLSHLLHAELHWLDVPQ